MDKYLAILILKGRVFLYKDVSYIIRYLFSSSIKDIMAITAET